MDDPGPIEYDRRPAFRSRAVTDHAYPKAGLSVAFPAISVVPERSRSEVESCHHPSRIRSDYETALALRGNVARSSRNASLCGGGLIGNARRRDARADAVVNVDDDE